MRQVFASIVSALAVKWSILATKSNPFLVLKGKNAFFFSFALINRPEILGLSWHFCILCYSKGRGEKWLLIQSDQRVSNIRVRFATKMLPSLLVRLNVFVIHQRVVDSNIYHSVTRSSWRGLCAKIGSSYSYVPMWDLFCDSSRQIIILNNSKKYSVQQNGWIPIVC